MVIRGGGARPGARFKPLCSPHSTPSDGVASVAGHTAAASSVAFTGLLSGETKTLLCDRRLVVAPGRLARPVPYLRLYWPKRRHLKAQAAALPPPPGGRLWPGAVHSPRCNGDGRLQLQCHTSLVVHHHGVQASHRRTGGSGIRASWGPRGATYAHSLPPRHPPQRRLYHRHRHQLTLLIFLPLCAARKASRLPRP